MSSCETIDDEWNYFLEAFANCKDNSSKIHKLKQQRHHIQAVIYTYENTPDKSSPLIYQSHELTLNKLWRDNFIRMKTIFVDRINNLITQLRDKEGMFLILRRLIDDDVKQYIVATSQ